MDWDALARSSRRSDGPAFKAVRSLCVQKRFVVAAFRVVWCVHPNGRRTATEAVCISDSTLQHYLIDRVSSVGMRAAYIDVAGRMRLRSVFRVLEMAAVSRTAQFGRAGADLIGSICPRKGCHNRLPLTCGDIDFPAAWLAAAHVKL